MPGRNSKMKAVITVRRNIEYLTFNGNIKHKISNLETNTPSDSMLLLTFLRSAGWRANNFWTEVACKGI